MPQSWTPPEPPSADGPTDIEVARYILERCRELARLAGPLDNEAIGRLLLETIDRTQDFLHANDRDDA